MRVRQSIGVPERGRVQPFLIQQVDRWGKALSMGYQDSGSYTNLTTITDALGRVMHLGYDENGHLVE